MRVLGGKAVRRFIVQAVIDGLIAIAVVFVLSLINITQPFPFGQESAPILQPVGGGILIYLVWGVIFALVNRVVRPVLVAVFGRWIFSTLGLFVVVITALTIAITSRLLPVQIAILADPQPLWLLLVAALFTLGSVVADVVLGLSRPHVGEPGGRSVWTFLD